MTKLYLIKSPTLEEELEEIQLPLFDIIIHEDENWIQKAIRELEENDLKY